MTTPSGPDESTHLSADVLADLDEGLLATTEADRARTHLLMCPACAGEHAALAELRQALAADDPGPMPADVVARLESALRAAEHPVDHPADRPAAAVTTLATRRAGRGPGRPPRWLMAAAAVTALVVAGGAVVAALQAGRDSGAVTASESAAQDSAAGAAGAPGAAGGPLVTRSGTDYDAASVETATRQLTSGGYAALGGTRDQAPASADPQAPTLAGGPAEQSAAAALDRLAAGPGLTACLAQLTDDGEAPIAVDLARFDGQPAALVVLPTPGETTTVDAWVVGPGCGEGGDAQVLYFRRVPR
ncbi:MAG TPA: hypothetical protein VLC50_03715 [Actinomycetes bacterium]|nr:hypothetical protein [Actinomycetes bacterium]